MNPQPISFSLESCPLSGVELIVGGQAAKSGEFPHMAAIGFQQQGSNGYDWDCAGSLISDLFVLTVAHCTTSFNGDYVINNIIRHPGYRPPAKYNDIALLRLRNPVRPFTQSLRPACLYQDPSFRFSRAVASGWGRLGNEDYPSDTLMKVNLDIIDPETCNRLYATDRNTNKLREGILPSMMCAGELRGGKDTCQGDSGGPIQIRGTSNKCVYYVLGLTSFGKICGVSNSAAVYTRVSYYLPWIEQNVWPSG
ncbi:hypothetical protein J437_LFUL011222 [Ladona fulva]|uniref:Peptidase S1 domain-containing protein n=1 Tax=Ladona fulva TaxID=123851 RepID=A0A8K0P407_LADFU|nr:hypothetical protein J437_LFUL011222 [Ladona fulva]